MVQETQREWSKAHLGLRISRPGSILEDYGLDWSNKDSQTKKKLFRKSLFIFTLVAPSNSQQIVSGLQASRTSMKSLSRWIIHKSGTAQTMDSIQSSGAFRDNS